MIESNNEKSVYLWKFLHSLTLSLHRLNLFLKIFTVFTLLMKNYVNMKKFLVKNLKTRWDKLIQSQTPGQHTKNQDCPGKTGTVGMFASHNFTTSKA